jgi:hypothetical protein
MMEGVLDPRSSMAPGRSGESNTNDKDMSRSDQLVPGGPFKSERPVSRSAEQTQLVEPLFWGGLACLRLDIGQTFACGTARIDQVSNDQ